MASPKVGDRVWLEQFKKLEKKGSVRHIRISNDGDRICVTPFLGYYQTGLNIHLYLDRKASIEYCKEWSRLSAIKCRSIRKMHAMSTYLDRLFMEENKDILKKSIEELYEEAVYAKDERTSINEIKEMLESGDHVSTMCREFFSD